MATNKPKKGTEKAQSSPSPLGRARVEIEVTALMKSTVTKSKKLVKDGYSKAETAREAYSALPKHERRQVIHVFMHGCGLSKAGAGTYYQNCKKQ